MNVGEVNSINQLNSYQGQGSSVKAPIVAEVKPVENDNSAVTSIKNDEKTEVGFLGENEANSNGVNSSLKEAVDKINSSGSSCEAVFSMHEGTNRVMIKMVDKVTKEVIKEFPAEKTLDLIAKAWEMAGIMVDTSR